MTPNTEELQQRLDFLQAERNDAIVALLKITETNRAKHGTPLKQLKRCQSIAATALKGIQL